MYQGMYDLTSSMLTHKRKLNVIGNNMVNVQTPGYKEDILVSETFDKAMVSRTNYYDKNSDKTLNEVSRIRAAKRTYTNFKQGAFSETGSNLDTAISGKGFFKVRLENNTEAYTRNGAFTIDDSGRLVLSGRGAVLDENNREIFLEDEEFRISKEGSILQLNEDGEEVIGKIALYDFDDYDQLVRGDNGIFTTTNQPERVNLGGETTLLNGYLEKSNTDMVTTMSDMMGSQRSIQSSAQLLKMYDQITGKSVNDIGRM